LKSLYVSYTKGSGWGDAMTASNSIPAQFYKEYAKSDSRYFQDDTFTLGIETFTFTVLTPLTFLTFLTHFPSSSHNSRHLPILRLLTSAMHLTTTSLYLFTEILRHHSDCRPEFLYKWVYMWGMNMPWIIIPSCMVWASWVELFNVMKIEEPARGVVGSHRMRLGRKKGE